jgi:hypothetical protein
MFPSALLSEIKTDNATGLELARHPGLVVGSGPPQYFRVKVTRMALCFRD